MFIVGALRARSFVFRPGELPNSLTVKNVIGDLYRNEGKFLNHEKHAQSDLCAKALHLHYTAPSYVGGPRKVRQREPPGDYD